MCIGLPMQVLERGDGFALCAGMGERRRVDTRLVGDVAVGSWLLVFLDSARERLSAERAAQVADALRALHAVARGEARVDHLFADLVDREPALPAHLQPTPSRTRHTE